VRDSSVVSVEALLRWRHPTQGKIAPGRFISLAEQLGDIVAIGEWVLRNACAQMCAWQTQGLDVSYVAVNLSMRQLEQPDLVARITAILHETGLPPHRLELEITESMAMQAPTTVLHALNGLHEFGVRIALDDFGVGYSSLAHLKRFPLDDLKIDREFVTSIGTDSEAAAVTRAIVALAASLGLKPVAEGVETAEQRDALRAQGCCEMQGYYFSRPLPAHEFAARLQAGQLSATMAAADRESTS